MINVRQLVKEYGSGKSFYRAVDDISFDVRPGEFFSLLGPNGAGKTTTISILSTILSPTSGDVVVNGTSVLDNPHLIRQHIGVIFQDPSLDDRLTAQENMDFHGRLYGMSPAARQSRTKFLLDMVDLSERKNALVRTFSGGMKRRLEIARGLMHQPLLLILDEPTIGLDPKSRRDIWHYIHSARKEWGMTVLLTTHYLDEADSADRVAIMNKGKIVALDAPESLKKMLGAGLVTLDVDFLHVDLVKKVLNDLYGVDQFTSDHPNTLRFPMPDRAESVAMLIQNLPPVLINFSVRSPTLDDVFLSLTGSGEDHERFG